MVQVVTLYISLFQECILKKTVNGEDQTGSPATCGSVLLQKATCPFFLVTLGKCQTKWHEDLNEMVKDVEILALHQTTIISKVKHMRSV